MKRLTVAALSFVGSKKKRTPPVEHQSKECGHPDKSPTGASSVSKMDSGEYGRLFGYFSHDGGDVLSTKYGNPGDGSC